MSVLTRAPEARTPAEPHTLSSPVERKRATAWTVAAVGTIWAAVVVISLFAPDFVSGSEQDHLPMAAILTWIWGVVATRNVVTAVIRRRRDPGIDDTARRMSLVVMPIWVLAAVVGVLGPEVVTGSDPTRVPIAAILAPIAAMILTGVVTQLFGAFHDSDEE